MNKIFYLICILSSLFISSCNVSTKKINKSVLIIEDFNLNHYSKNGTKVYMLETPYSVFNQTDQSYLFEKTNIEFFNKEKVKYDVNSDSAKLLNNKILELKGNIEINDYRDLKNNYNSIASIEMIEAVGKDYLESYFRTIKNNLSNDGNVGIQAITIDDSLFDRYKTKQDFIQRYIFPGGFLPNKGSIDKYVKENGLIMNSYKSYSDHYSNTLALWRNQFNKKWDLIKKQGFDYTFKRMWEFYLSYCEAGFKSKNIDLIQFSLQNK